MKNKTNKLLMIWLLASIVLLVIGVISNSVPILAVSGGSVVLWAMVSFVGSTIKTAKRSKQDRNGMTVWYGIVLGLMLAGGGIMSFVELGPTPLGLFFTAAGIALFVALLLRTKNQKRSKSKNDDDEAEKW